MVGTETSAEKRSWFSARRIGHVNLYISDYERALDFYRRVVGLHGGWTRPKISGGFLNNGASHHDVGFLPWHSPERRVVVDGPGLNHLAFDVGTEVQLTDGYRSATGDSFVFMAAADHVVAKSLYCTAPGGTQIEIYSDTAIPFTDPDFLAMRRATVAFDPLAIAAPDPQPHYVVDHRPTISPETVFHAARLDGATLVVDDLAGTTDFFRRCLGLRQAVIEASGYALLQGELGCRDLVLLASTASLPAGLHHFSFTVIDAASLDESVTKARAEGLEIVKEIDNDVQRAVVIRDPDGRLVKLFVDREADFWRSRPLSHDEALWLL